MRLFSIMIVFLFLHAAIAHAADINPKSVDSITARVVQSGSITINGRITTLNLTLYIPQDGIQSISVYSDNWKYAQDSFGNRQVVIEWSEPEGVLLYRIETTVKNSASYLYSDSNTGYDEAFLKETPQIVFNDEMRKIAYPYERSMKRAVELSSWVNSYLTYDSSYADRRLPSDKVLLERRGVCVEHANLLTSLLRISGIPTKYITGYSYSNIDKKFIGHAWVEVLSGEGEWVGIDPTWNEAGYIDAMHIKTAEMLDENQTELLSYKGSGKVNWTRDSEEIELLDYNEKNPVEILADDSTFYNNGYGFVKARFTSSCMLMDVTAKSCVDDRGSDVFDIYEKERKIWNCGERYIYWFFRPRAIGENILYTCPVSLFDQTGAKTSIDIGIRDRKNVDDVFISGPDSVGIGQEFELSSSREYGFIFYSSTLGERQQNAKWQLSLARPGIYNFYLYSGGALAKKEVQVLETVEFSISAEIPKNVTLGSSFLFPISVKNLESKEKTGRIRVEFDGKMFESDFSISPGSSYRTVFNLTAGGIGTKVVSVSAMGNSVATYSGQILVYQHKERTFFDSIAEFFAGLFNAIGDFFDSIF